MQGRVSSSNQHQMDRWWLVFEQEIDSLVNRRSCDQVIIVESQRDFGPNGIYLVDQHCKQGLNRRGLRSLNHSKYDAAKSFVYPLQRGDEVSQKASQVVIIFIQ